MIPLWADVSLVFQPVRPWSSPLVGIPGLIAVAVLLFVVTALTYLVGQRGNWQRFLVMVGLRFAALIIAFLLILRPSLAFVDTSVAPSKLLVHVDATESMKITDEFNDQSRWDAVGRIFKSSDIKAQIERLQRDQKTEFSFTMGTEEIAKLDLDGPPVGKRSPIGYWIQQLFRRHGNEESLRGLVVFSDGADNDGRFSPIEEAKKWRAIGCPVSTFVVGQTTTTLKQRDIYFLQDRIFSTPNPVPTKTRFTVKSVMNAPGFENARITLRLLINGKENGSPKTVTLSKTEDNEVDIVADAPSTPGEYKITLKVDPLPGEVSQSNNEISTYLTVSDEGLTILWVEGKKRAFESVFALRHALNKDPRFRVYFSERLPEGEAKPPADKDLYELTKRHYDVIVIGDISGSRFSAGEEKVFQKINQMVKEKKTGLLLLGGYESFANSDWQKYPALTEMLPVFLNQPGQVEGPVKVVPTEKGFKHFVMKLAEDANVNEVRWQTLFSPLDGMTRIGTVKDTATVLATQLGGDPLLAVQQFGEGRVVAFGADTTWKAWRKNYEAIAAYEQFWKRLMLWLAYQENTSDQVWVKLETRRLPAGGNQRQGIIVGMRGKTGLPVADAKFQVKVISPNNQETDVAIQKENEEEKGYFWKTNLPGEYQVLVKATGKQGQEALEGGVEARFLCYSEDWENLRPAADHDLMMRVASAGNGQFQVGGEKEFLQFLRDLEKKPLARSVGRAELWPDWKRDPAGEGLGSQVSALFSSGILVCYFLFTLLLCLEWFLRRRWGLV